MRTSVIVPTRNRVDEAIKFIKSLYNQVELPDEFIIVDSSDVSIISHREFNDIFKKMEGKIALYYIYTEPGSSKQKNTGIKTASGDIIYFFDDDTILEPDYLQIMNKTFNENPDYMGGMGTIIGIPQLFFRGKIINAFKRVFLLQHDYGNGKFQKSGFAKHPYGTGEFKEVEVLGGCGMAYRRDVLKHSNFDEHLDEERTGYSYMEDADLSRRVSYRNKLFYNPKAKLEHRRVLGGRGNIRNKRKMYMVSHRYLFFKNFYIKNKLYIISHWWSIVGLIVNSFIFESKEARKGYLDGLKEFKRRRKEFL